MKWMFDMPNEDKWFFAFLLLAFGIPFFPLIVRLMRR